MYYTKIHRVHSKSRFQVKDWASLKSKLKRTGRGGEGAQLTKAAIHWGGDGGQVKRTGTNKGGGGPKTFSANILFEWPYTPHKWVIPNVHFSNIWWNAIKVGGKLPVKNNLILASSLVLVKKYVNLQHFFQ